MAVVLTQVDQTGFPKIDKYREVVEVPLRKSRWHGLANGLYQNLLADEELMLNPCDQSQIYYNVGKEKKNKVKQEFPSSKAF